jgi:ABC-type phosphonate transport system ATPase subunit
MPWRRSTASDLEVQQLEVPPPEVLHLQGIGKAYGPVVACDAVDLAVHAGEIHGLLGETERASPP